MKKVPSESVDDGGMRADNGCSRAGNCPPIRQRGRWTGKNEAENRERKETTRGQIANQKRGKTKENTGKVNKTRPRAQLKDNPCIPACKVRGRERDIVKYKVHITRGRTRGVSGPRQGWLCDAVEKTVVSSPEGGIGRKVGAWARREGDAGECRGRSECVREKEERVNQRKDQKEREHARQKKKGKSTPKVAK